mmetsp:Transcript_45291/g.107995  ORF Transcript_45291/g.107995 Transcript_45291/m.107995 type:complete len:268 (-) Transcript_45291:698-1501(-)
MLRTELRALPEYLLYHRVVVLVPVDARLRHQHRYVPFEGLIVVLERALDGLVLPRQPRVLDLLRQPSQHLDVAVGEAVELVVGLVGACLQQDRRVQETVEIRREVLVRQRRVVRHDVGGKVVVLVLAVEEQKVPERLGRERRLPHQPVHLLEASSRVLLHVHQREVVQRYRVEFFLGAGGHVREGLLGRACVLHHVLDRCLEVESLNEGSLLQHGRVPDRADVNAFRVGPNRQLRVLPNPLLDNVGDELHGRPVLLDPVVTQSDVVR